MNLKIFLESFLLIFLIVLSVGFFVWNLNVSKNINLLELQESGQQVGYLYQVKEKLTGEKYYLVSDKKLEGEGVKEDLNLNKFEFEYLDESYLWNPSSCAKMPSVVDVVGNIYMIDVQYLGDRFAKKFIIYNRADNQKKYLDITHRDLPKDFAEYESKLTKAKKGKDGVLEVAMPEPENFPTDFVLDTTDLNIYVVGKF